MGRVRMPAPLSPLVSGTTYRRGVHLLLGGVILLPYLLLGVVFANMLAGPRGGRPAALLLLVAAAAIAAVPALVSPELCGCPIYRQNPSSMWHQP